MGAADGGDAADIDDPLQPRQCGHLGQRRVEARVEPTGQGQVQQLGGVQQPSKLGLTLGQIALAWVLRRPEVTSAIIGATKLAHVDEDVSVADIDLDAGTLDAIERALA